MVCSTIGREKGREEGTKRARREGKRRKAKRRPKRKRRVVFWGCFNCEEEGGAEIEPHVSRAWSGVVHVERELV